MIPRLCVTTLSLTDLQAHLFTAHKANWFDITDGLPCFAERAPGAE